ncbi:MAG: flagellar biosynthetic protein FliO [Planctomycetota bacterium]
MFLITFAMGGVVLVICSAQPATTGMESEETGLDSNQSKEAAKSEDSLSANDQDYFRGLEYNAVGWELFVKAILAILFVLALFIIAIYVSKKILPKITNLPGKEIRIVETVHLGPRKAVHLLEINNRRFLIGSTNESVTKLADLGSDLMELPANEVNYN